MAGLVGMGWLRKQNKERKTTSRRMKNQKVDQGLAGLAGVGWQRKQNK